MVEPVSIYDEDEDVIVQGSTLHKHLCKLGYIDFETVPSQHMHIKRQTLPTFSDVVLVAKSVYKKLNFIYSWILQEDVIAHTSLSTILSAQILLDDHATVIENSIQLYSPQPWNYKLPICIVLCSSALAIYTLLKHRNILGFLCPSAVAYSIISMTWLQFSAHNNLKKVVSLQNDLYCLCKKGLKILRSDYKFKTGLGQTCDQFHDLISDRLCYLQPLMECLISYMENVSYLCYKTSLIITEVLPKHSSVETLLTKFQYKSFTLHGGISYQSLKRLYHTHVLVQSEMLQLIAIAYNVNTWSESYCKIPEMKLNSICQALHKHLFIYRDKLKGIIDRYYNSERTFIRLEYKHPVGSIWHELYLQLDITAHKIQLAYTNVLSIIRDIDETSSESSISRDRIETMMNKINEICKELETAKNFAELSNLTIARTKVVNYEKSNIVRAAEMSDVNSELPVVIDTEPEIVDEVFEEYIKEEYLKPFLEDGYELELPKSKLDKLLLKTFMSELKEALIDKQKSMNERETKALQRMYKNILKDSQETTETSTGSSIPTPPPLPPWNICLPRDNYTDQSRDNCCASERQQRDSYKEYGQQSVMYPQGDIQEESETLSFRLEPPPSQFLFKFPPSFMKVPEEVFAGSGENSEEELTDVDLETDANTA